MRLLSTPSMTLFWLRWAQLRPQNFSYNAFFFFFSKIRNGSNWPKHHMKGLIQNTQWTLSETPLILDNKAHQYVKLFRGDKDLGSDGKKKCDFLFGMHKKAGLNHSSRCDVHGCSDHTLPPGDLRGLSLSKLAQYAETYRKLQHSGFAFICWAAQHQNTAGLQSSCSPPEGWNHPEVSWDDV